MKKDKNPSWMDELGYYAKKHKRFWLLPLIVVLVLFGALVIVAEGVPMVSPFIYTLF